jgi:hypothetical protein
VLHDVSRVCTGESLHVGFNKRLIKYTVGAAEEGRWEKSELPHHIIKADPEGLLRTSEIGVLEG